MHASTLRLTLAAILIAVAFGPGRVALEAQRLPLDTRVRVTTAEDGETTRFVGTVVAMGRDTLHVYDRDLDRHRLFPIMSIVSVERSDGIQSRTFQDRALTVAMFAGVGTVLGWATWHACHDPEDPESLNIVSCFLAPGRLGTAVRGGAWAGTGLGLMLALVRGQSEKWTRVPLVSNGPLFIVPSANGARLGMTFAF